MRQECARVDIDGVSARWLHDWYSGLGDPISQIRGQPNAVLQIVLLVYRAPSLRHFTARLRRAGESARA